jgi:hypothetical protein
MNAEQRIDKPVKIETPQWSMKNSFVPAIGRGLLPLIVTIAIGAFAIVLIMLVRLLVDPVKYFLLQQALFAVIMIGALACIIIAFIVTTRRILKCIKMWREGSETAKVKAATMTMLLVGFVLIVPILLTLLLGAGV